MTAQRVREKIQKAEAEISAGRLWRAKEMFRGYIASETYALEPVRDSDTQNFAPVIAHDHPPLPIASRHMVDTVLHFNPQWP